MLYYDSPTREVLSHLQSHTDGLSTHEAAARLRQYGPNLVAVKSEPLWRKIIEPFASVFVLVLFVAAGISLWHHAYIDAGIVIAIIMVSAAIYYVQRYSTERILRALQKKDQIRVAVLRDRHVDEIDASRIVPGDIIILNEGEKVPADARLMLVHSLRVDESQLTGESLPISKLSKTLSDSKEIYEQSNMVFQGSFVIGGEARAIVVRTGNATEFGHIAALSSTIEIKSPVEAKIDRLITQLIIVIAAISICAFGLSLYRGVELSEALRFVIALAVSAVPEGLPVAITVVLVLGMRRMAARKALVRNMHAIETIGALTTIATDKTGTLTKNKLTVQSTWSPDQTDSSIAQHALKAANIYQSKVHDPLDLAIEDYSQRFRIKPRSVRPAASFPFDQSTAMSGNTWHHGSTCITYIKGAPERILDVSDMTDNERERARLKLQELAGSGARVIALARYLSPTVPSSLHSMSTRGHFDFIGYIAIADKIRREAVAAVRQAIAAGISVRMVTGDHQETAYHIGHQLGMLESRDQVFDSRSIHTLDEQQLDSRVGQSRVFARVIPEHKHRILTSLKKHEITAMTGDGVNDVPALTNAHVGIAMGGGTQIAKEAGDIILLDNNFRTIISAVAEGRTIYSNIKRMVAYLLATNLGEVLVALFALIVGMPVALVPVQILWINLVTDTSMVIPLGLEPGDKQVMKRPPLDPNAPLFSRYMIGRILLTACVMAVVTIGFYDYFSSRYGVEYGRTIAFCTLAVMQWASAFSFRSDYQPAWHMIRHFNPWFYVGIIGSIALQVLAVFGPLAPYLHVAPAAIGDIYVASLSGFIITVLAIEAHKWLGRTMKLT